MAVFDIAVDERTSTTLNDQNLDPLLNPQSIAVIGASSDPRRIGGIALNHMVNFKYQGTVYPVNPKHELLHGLKCYPDIEALPQAPDLVVLAVSSEQVLPLLSRCHAKGVAAAILYATGFAEESEAGAELQRELSEFAQTTGMLICGPNCMGLANLNTRAITAFATTFTDYPPQQERGNVGLVTQSGNICAVLYIAGYERGLKFNHFINTGNEACLEYSEYLNFLADDPTTHMAVGYVEGLRNGPRFIEVAEKFRQKCKPLVILKAGDTDKASQVVLSHTAALAGDRVINKAAFRQLGVMQARDPGELADLAYIASFDKRPTDAGVVIASVSGAMGAILTDLVSNAGAEVPTLPLDIQQTLKDRVSGIGMVANPIDMTAQIFNREGVAREVLTAITVAQEASTTLVYATGFMLDRIAAELIEVAGGSDKLFVVVDTGKAKCRRELELAGIPIFTDVARAANALGGYLQWCSGSARRAHWAALRDAKRITLLRSDVNLSRLDEYETKRLLLSYGVHGAQEHRVDSADDAVHSALSIGFPVAMKILSPDIHHKSDVNGVRLNLRSETQVLEAYADMVASARAAQPDAEIRGVLVSRMETGVCELIVGVARDPVFGLSMTVGLGGIFTEIFRDTSHRLLPVDKTIAEEMLKELRGYQLLTGFRGAPLGDVNAACQAIEAISQMTLELRENLEAMEVNPLLVRENGKGAVALDALIVAKPEGK